jgi:imidazolonepropionase-like amidohydrolase
MELSRKVLQAEMRFEKSFVAAGGHLTAGTDPTGWGGTLPGPGNHAELRLLVEAGFTPLEAIRIATLNGARYLGAEGRIGTLAAGKQADLLLVDGKPDEDIKDIAKIDEVFRNGIGYDPRKLIADVRGKVGR